MATDYGDQALRHTKLGKALLDLACQQDGRLADYLFGYSAMVGSQGPEAEAFAQVTLSAREALEVNDNIDDVADMDDLVGYAKRISGAIRKAHADLETLPERQDADLTEILRTETKTIIARHGLALKLAESAVCLFAAAACAVKARDGYAEMERLDGEPTDGV